VAVERKGMPLFTLKVWSGMGSRGKWQRVEGGGGIATVERKEIGKGKGKGKGEYRMHSCCCWERYLFY